MKALRMTLAIGALIAAASSALAQAGTFEYEAQRTPTTVTNGSCLIKHGRLLTVSHGTLEDTDILIEKGKIVRIGKGLSAPAGVTVIDATGKIVTPGLVDAHSHRGITETNEATDSLVPEVQIRDVLDTYQDGLYYDLANGITSALVLHGSANAIGGQSIVVKNKWKRSISEMIFQGAPRMIKFALGENPKRVQNDGGPGRFPVTRMGVEAVYRRGFIDARAYMRMWDEYNKNPKGTPPRKDLRLETLADILRGKIWVQCHSYRQDEMLMMARLSQEFGYHLVLQHALEGYKIAPELAAAHIGLSQFADTWAYKIEVYDSIPGSSAICIKAGVLTSVNTDTFSGIAPMNLDAAKAMRYGVSELDAFKTITINPAIELGIDKKVGTLDEGKDADIAIWQGHPMSPFSRCEMTLIDGDVVFQRRDLLGLNSQAYTKDTIVPTNSTADLDPIPAWSDVYAIVGGTVHPVDGPEIPNGVVVIRNNKIEAVGANVKVPAGAVVVNARGKHVYPGLIDGGSDLGLNEIGSDPMTIDSNENGQFNPDMWALHALNPETTRIPIARCGGVTTALIAPGGGLISGRGSIVNLAGYNREQMSMVDLAVLSVNFPDLGFNFQGVPSPSRLPEVRRNFDQRVKQLGQYFDSVERYIEARAKDAVAIDPKLEAMVPYVKGEKLIGFVCNSALAIKEALKFAKDRDLKIVIVGGAQAWRAAKELADAKVAVLYNGPNVACPGATTAFPGDPYDSPYSAPAILRQAGVKVGFLSGDSSAIQNLALVAGVCCSRGLTRDDALRAITLSTAEILGIDEQVGSLKAGKLANVIVCDGDVLDVTTHVTTEFINGKPVTLKSKFTELYRKYEKRLGK